MAGCGGKKRRAFLATLSLHLRCYIEECRELYTFSILAQMPRRVARSHAVQQKVLRFALALAGARNKVAVRLQRRR